MIAKDLEAVANIINNMTRLTQGAMQMSSSERVEAEFAFQRIRSFCESSLLVRLARVEEDLRAFRAEHEKEPELKRCPNCSLRHGARPLLSQDARNAIQRLAKALCVAPQSDLTDSDYLHGLANVVEARAAGLVLRAPRDGGSWANVVHDDGKIKPEDLIALLKINGVDLGADQDVRSWAKIEEWHTKQATGNALSVSFQGPFERHALSSGSVMGAFYYTELPGGHSSRGNTRSDALAHAAQWCEHELAKARPVVDLEKAHEAVMQGGKS